MALRGEPQTVYGEGEQARCFCVVRDGARAIIGLAECPAVGVGQVFNIGSMEEISIVDLAHKVLALVDSGGQERGQSEFRNWRTRRVGALR